MSRALHSRCLAVAGAMLALAAAIPAALAEPSRGQQLYETHCINCHTVSVHGREKRAAQDFDGIRQWVARWNANIALGWSDEEIGEVAFYLNERYYGFACPPDVCKVVSRAPPPGTR